MDTTDPDIVFDAAGVCSHCHRYEMVARQRIIPPEQRKGRLDQLVTEIKRTGQNKPYDCVIGVSGGVDSTYVAWVVKHLGLRPLAVHLDNGWNSELAVANIEKILNRLGIDLFTHVIDWEEFRDLLTRQSAKGHALTMRQVQMKRPSIYELGERMAQLTVPTLIMTGDEDEACLEPALYMKRTIRTLGWRFNADRMVMDYTQKCYVPAAGGMSSDLSKKL